MPSNPKVGFLAIWMTDFPSQVWTLDTPPTVIFTMKAFDERFPRKIRRNAHNANFCSCRRPNSIFQNLTTTCWVAAAACGMSYEQQKGLPETHATQKLFSRLELLKHPWQPWTCVWRGWTWQADTRNSLLENFSSCCSLVGRRCNFVNFGNIWLTRRSLSGVDRTLKLPPLTQHIFEFSLKNNFWLHKRDPEPRANFLSSPNDHWHY